MLARNYKDDIRQKLESLNIIARNMVWLWVPTRWLTILLKLIFKGFNTFLSTFLEPKRSIQREIRKISIFTVAPKQIAPGKVNEGKRNYGEVHTTLEGENHQELETTLKGTNNSWTDIHVHALEKLVVWQWTVSVGASLAGKRHHAHSNSSKGKHIIGIGASTFRVLVHYHNSRTHCRL